MKAAIHNPYWDSLGGGERYTAAFAKLLLDQGWQVDINWPANISNSVLDRFGIDISRAKFIHNLSTPNYNLLFWLSDGSLPTSFAKKTIVHFQFPFQNVQGDSLSNLLKSRFYKFIANSQFTKKAIDKEFKVDCHIIYPPIDTSLFKPGKKENTIFYIGRFSRLTQLKGQEVLVKSFQKIHKQHPSWKLVLAGGVGIGTSPKDVENLKLSAKGLPVEFMLNPSFTDIQKLCALGKIFWSASGYGANDPVRTEHFGITVVEAMSAGAVPVITNLGGHPEIIDHGKSGLLWDSPGQLEKLTQDLITNESKISTLSQEAIIKSKMFDISQFNAQFKKLL